MNTHTNVHVMLPAEPEVECAPRSARFERFAAAMEADPPQRAQLVGELIQSSPDAEATPRLVWLGIGGWVMVCLAFFASLLPGPDAFDRGIGTGSDQIQNGGTVSYVRPSVNHDKTQQTPKMEGSPSSDGPKALSVATAVEGYLGVRPALRRVAEEGPKESNPVASDTGIRGFSASPRPRFKPTINPAAVTVLDSGPEN